MWVFRLFVVLTLIITGRRVRAGAIHLSGGMVCFFARADNLTGGRGNGCAAMRISYANVRIFYAGGIIYSRGGKVIGGAE